MSTLTLRDNTQWPDLEVVVTQSEKQFENERKLILSALEPLLPTDDCLKD